MHKLALGGSRAQLTVPCVPLCNDCATMRTWRLLKCTVRTSCCSTPKKSIAIKRRQRRKQKARKRLMRKFGGSSSQAHTFPDQVCVSHPNLLTPPVTPLEIPKHKHVNSLPIHEETGTSDTDSYPGDHHQEKLNVGNWTFSNRNMVII